MKKSLENKVQLSVAYPSTRSRIKIVIVCIAIGILYNLGFVWGTDDIKHKLRLHNFFDNDPSEKN